MPHSYTPLVSSTKHPPFLPLSCYNCSAFLQPDCHLTTPSGGLKKPTFCKARNALFQGAVILDTLVGQPPPHLECSWQHTDAVACQCVSQACLAAAVVQLGPSLATLSLALAVNVQDQLQQQQRSYTQQEQEESKEEVMKGKGVHMGEVVLEGKGVWLQGVEGPYSTEVKCKATGVKIRAVR